MRLRTDYENAMHALMPYFRERASRIMSRRYGVSQSSISSMLGITQAAVSKYLSDSHHTHTITGVEGADVYIYKFIENKMSGDDKAAQRNLCQLCQAYKRFACNLVVK